MKLSTVLTFNAVLWMATGIAFAMYGPLMLPYFKIPELNIEAEIYWQIAAFARMFGAVMFGAGLLIWALRGSADLLAGPARRGILMALLLGSLFSLVVSAVQQVSIWGTPVGWILTAIFLLFTLAYGVLLFTGESKPGQP